MSDAVLRAADGLRRLRLTYQVLGCTARDGGCEGRRRVSGRRGWPGTVGAAATSTMQYAEMVTRSCLPGQRHLPVGA